jgi:2-iminobutanoate/2-iminopropanoate deaminase
VRFDLASKERIHTEHAPAALGAYSQAIKLSGSIFTAGQIALDPKTGELVEGGIVEQTTRVLDNLKAVLEAAGASLDDVVKTTVFLSNMSDFVQMNDIYKQYFNSNTPPARSTVQVAGLPRGAMVEIECIASI